MNKQYDVIIFGATGYTGKFAIREGIKILDGLKWAVAGRNKEKLESMLLKVGSSVNTDLSKIPIIIADVEDEKSIMAMTALTKVIVNCCGPYTLYGEVVVKACIDSATSHVDVSGEPQFIEKMQLKYHELAREKGIYIISACGIESIPAEMGIIFMEQNFKGTINSVESYLRLYYDKDVDESGAFINSGTFYSALHVVAEFWDVLRIRRQLFTKPLPSLEPKLKSRLIHKRNFGEKDEWCIPMYEPDPSVVMRSQRYFYENENKRPVQIHSYLVLDKFYKVLASMFTTMFMVLLAPLSCTRKLLIKYPAFFSFGIFSRKGPIEEKMDKTNFDAILIGEGWKDGSFNPTDTKTKPPNKKVTVKISGKNPAYGATTVALLLSAKTILTESNKMPENGGVFAPGAAFRKTNMIDMLEKNGFSFDISEN